MDWIACVGIDWGDKRHAYMIQTREGSKQAGWFGSSAEEVHEWARGLGERFPAGTIIVAVEQGRGSLLYALMAYEYLVLVPINPRASKAYRSFRVAGVEAGRGANTKDPSFVRATPLTGGSADRSDPRSVGSPQRVLSSGAAMVWRREVTTSARLSDSLGDTRASAPGKRG